MEIMSLNKVFKIYKQGEVEAVALRGASLSIESGTTTAILGRSGSGKSTLLHLIGGLITPTAGKISIDGQVISQMNEAERADFRRKNIGIVYQSDNLVPFLSAQENVELPIRLAGGKKAGARAKELLAELGLGQRLHHKGAFLSGGERQRVAIAVALANQPRILLADELTGELDSQTAEAVMASLKALCSALGNSLIIVTHNPQVAQTVNQRFYLEDGEFMAHQEAAHG